MKPEHHLRITMPDLSPQAAYALSCWLECLCHEISLYYSVEIRSEITRRDNAGDDEFNDPIPF